MPQPTCCTVRLLCCTIRGITAGDGVFGARVSHGGSFTNAKFAVLWQTLKLSQRDDAQALCLPQSRYNTWLATKHFTISSGRAPPVARRGCRLPLGEVAGTPDPAALFSSVAGMKDVLERQFKVFAVRTAVTWLVMRRCSQHALRDAGGCMVLAYQSHRAILLLVIHKLIIKHCTH